MSKDDETVKPIHFREIWEEDFYLSESEVSEWINDIVEIINDDSLGVHEKMQAIVDCVA